MVWGAVSGVIYDLCRLDGGKAFRPPTCRIIILWIVFCAVYHHPLACSARSPRCWNGFAVFSLDCSAAHLVQNRYSKIRNKGDAFARGAAKPCLRSNRRKACQSSVANDPQNARENGVIHQRVMASGRPPDHSAPLCYFASAALNFRITGPASLWKNQGRNVNQSQKSITLFQ